MYFAVRLMSALLAVIILILACIIQILLLFICWQFFILVYIWTFDGLNIVFWGCLLRLKFRNIWLCIFLYNKDIYVTE